MTQPRDLIVEVNDVYGRLMISVSRREYGDDGSVTRDDLVCTTAILIEDADRIIVNENVWVDELNAQ